RQALSGEGCRDELALARRRRRTVGERQVRPRQREPHRLLALELIERDRAYVRRAASQGRAECRVVATRVVLGGDAERARERREDVPVRARLALRRDHPVRVLEVELTERAV